MGFWEFYRTVVKRRWMIAGLVFATVIGIFIATSNQKAYYQATSRIMPSEAALSGPLLPAVANPFGGASGDGRGGGQLANLMSLITSRTVAERTVQSLQIDTSPDRLRKNVTVSTAPNPGATSRNDRGTDIIEITVKDGDPERAVQIVNGIAMVFANYYQEITHEASVENVNSLERELAAAKRELDTAAAKLKQYKQAHNITSLESETTATVGNVKQMEAQRAQAAAELADVNAQLNQLTAQLRGMAPTRTRVEGTTDSPMVQELERQVASLTSQLSQARSKYLDTHPVVQDMQTQLNDATKKLDAEKSKVRTTTTVVTNPIYERLRDQMVDLKNRRDGLAARVRVLDAEVGRAGGGLRPGEDVELQRLAQEFTDAQTAVTNLRARLDQAKLAQNDQTDTGAIRLVDRAVAAEGPIGRSRTSFILLGAFMSLLVGLGLAVLLEGLDNRIKDNQDVEQLLSLPVTTLIPSMEGRSAPALPRITYLEPLSPLAEAFRFLRTDILLSAAESDCRTIMIATAKPGQGGTTTAANLAIAMAMDGKRVVIVDADMRRPLMHKIFKTTNDLGLANVLVGEKEIEDVLIATEISGLLLLPAGQPPSNPSELLGSPKMGEVVQKLKNDADFVIFDTPAAIAFTDCVVMTQWIDGVVMVVRANQVPRGAELQVRRLFNKANVKILGVVLNDVQPNNVDSYYYHSHYYPASKPGQFSLPVIPVHKRHAIEEVEEDEEEQRETVV